VVISNPSYCMQFVITAYKVESDGKHVEIWEFLKQPVFYKIFLKIWKK
jgi:hypothetical protein